MQQANQLIRTKLRLPFTRPGLVSRPRLAEQIAQGLRGPLIVVTAPAGFGKTTLIAACVAGCGMPVAWLSLDKNDNQEGRFLSYLIAALQAADGRIGSEAAQLMAGMQQAQPEAVLTSLINDLDRVNEEMVLVLDDYQLMGSQAVHEQLTFLLEHRPAALHLVIGTRADPPLPLARMRARGQVVELRAADLRFTGPEAERFLQDVMGLQLDQGLVEVLEARTEGWIAGLQMAALSMRERKDTREFIEGFSGTNRYILDYLLEEVLASQSFEIQHFLLQTSFLDRLSAPLCDAVLANDLFPLPVEERSVPSTHGALRLSGPILSYLERENLFLVSMDEERAWYRYHHLFADLLRARLEQAQPDLTPLLHLRASAWFEQNGWIIDAIQHLLAAKQENQAADLIERYGPTRWAESDPSIIQMADSLPPEILNTRPKIGLYQAWRLIIRGNIYRAVQLLDELSRSVGRYAPDSEQHWILMFIGLMQAFLGRREGAVVSNLPGEEALDEIPGGELILRDAAEVLYGMTLARKGEIDRAAAFSIRCIQQEKPAGESLSISTLIPFLAHIYLMQGRLHTAADFCHKYLNPIQQKGIRFIYSAASMNIVLGEVFLEWNCLEESEKHIREGMQANEPWKNIMMDSFLLSVLIRIFQARGDFSGALQMFDKFEARIRGDSCPIEFREEILTQRARLLLASGDLKSASLWAAQVIHSQEYHRFEEYYRFTLAHIRLAEGRYSDVIELLTEPSNPALSNNRVARQIAIDLLLAAAEAGLNHWPEAMRLVGASLDLAEPEGYIRSFLEVGEPARNLLAAYVRSTEPVHQPYAQQVLDAFLPQAKVVPSMPQPTGLVEPLSARELEVLQLMALGRTNPEIARQLIVAPGTIKAHAASIYRKLDVANRTEAVARARQLGILS